MKKNNIWIYYTVAAVIAFSVGFYFSASGSDNKKQYYTVTKDFKNPKVRAKHIKELVKHFGKPLKEGKHSLTFWMSKDDINRLGVPDGVLVEPLVKFGIPKTSCSPEPPKPPSPLPDPPPNTQVVDWGVARVQGHIAQQTETASNVKVCVLDTGIDLNHSDVKFFMGYNFTAGDPLDFADRAFHGTHVAGIVSAVNNSFGVIGVSQAKILVGKVLDDSGSGYNADISEGIHWCVDQKADIINLSLGGPNPSVLIENALYRATAAGIWVFSAAGNNANDEPSYPAYYPNVFSVSSTNKLDQLSWFSSFGKVDFACPGEDILSTIPWNNYDRYDGTSMATPMCAGAAAFFRAKNKPLIARPLGDPVKFGRGILVATDAL